MGDLSSGIQTMQTAVESALSSNAAALFGLLALFVGVRWIIALIERFIGSFNTLGMASGIRSMEQQEMRLADSASLLTSRGYERGPLGNWRKVRE